MALTKAELMKVPGTDKPQFIAWSGHPGLYLRIKLDPTLADDNRAKGVSRIWYWRGTLRHAARMKSLRPEPIWIALGSAFLARMTDNWLSEEAQRLKRLCKLGQDPRVQETPTESVKVDTLDEAWAKFLVVQKSGVSQGYRDDISRKWAFSISRIPIEIEKGQRVPLGVLPLDALRITHLDDFFQAISDRPVASNRMLRILREFVPWAQDRCPGMAMNLLKGRKYHPEDPAEDWLEESEVIQFGEVLHTRKYKHQWAILLLLLTGCRSGVMLHWDPTWDHGDYLEIPARTPGLKNPRKTIYVLIPPVVRNIIPRLVPVTKKGLEGCISCICKQAGVTRPDRKSLSPHDLRDTFISTGTSPELGYLEEVMLAITQHSSRNPMGRRYNHREMLKLLPMATATANRLVELMGIQQLVG